VLAESRELAGFLRPALLDPAPFDGPTDPPLGRESARHLCWG